MKGHSYLMVVMSVCAGMALNQEQIVVAVIAGICALVCFYFHIKEKNDVLVPQ